MKRLRFLLSILLVAVVVAAAVPNNAVAGTPAPFTVTVTVDENGNGTFVNSAGFFALLSGLLLPDPGPGGLPSALFYGTLSPPGLVAGDLIIRETLGGPISDVIRFNPSLNGGGLFFYSDNADGVDALADVGLPSAFNTNLLEVLEVGPEGNNGFIYTPLPGQPGFVAGAAGPVTYVIQSDTPIPEPAALALLATGLLGLRAARRRRI